MNEWTISQKLKMCKLAKANFHDFLQKKIVQKWWEEECDAKICCLKHKQKMCPTSFVYFFALFKYFTGRLDYNILLNQRSNGCSALVKFDHFNTLQDLITTLFK